MLSPEEIQSYRNKYKINPIDVPTPAKQGLMGKSIGEAFGAGVNKIKGSIQDSKAGQNPISTGAKFGAGLVETAFSPLAPLTKPVGEFVGKGINAVADRVSENAGVQDFAMSKAGGVTEQIVEDVGNLNTIAGAGTMQKIPAVASTGVRAAAGVAKPVSRAAGKTFKSAGEGAYGLTITPEASTAESLMNYAAKQPKFVGRLKNMVKGEGVGEKPITEANTAARHGLAGTEFQLGVQGKQVRQSIWDNTIKPKLADKTSKVNMKSYLGDIEKEIKKSGGDITRRKALQEAFEKVKDDYKNVGDVSYEKLQDYKEGWAEFIPDATYKGKPIASSLKEVHSLMAGKAREMLYEKVGPGGRQAYIDYGNLKSIIEAGKKSIQGDPASKSLSRDVWQFVMNKAVTPVATVAGKVLYKTGEGLEFIGKEGAKTVKEVVD